MNGKPQTIIPVGTKITRLAPSEGKGKSLYALAKAEERKLERQEAIKDRAQRFAAALKVGYTAVEALELTKNF